MMFYVGAPSFTVGDLARAAMRSVASPMETTIALGTSQAAVRGVEALREGQKLAQELVEPVTWGVGRAIQRTFVVPKLLAKISPVDVVEDCETFLAVGLMGLQVGLSVAAQGAFGDARKNLAKHSVALLSPLAEAVDCTQSQREVLDANLAFLRAVRDKDSNIAVAYSYREGTLKIFT